MTASAMDSKQPTMAAMSTNVSNTKTAPFTSDCGHATSISALVGLVNREQQKRGEIMLKKSKDKVLQLAQRLQDELKACGGSVVVVTPCMIVIVPQSMENSNQKGDTP